MYTGPTVKFMVDRGIDVEKAKRIRKVIKDPRDFHDYDKFFTEYGEFLSKNFSKTYVWVNGCHNMPSDHEIRLEMINEVLEGYGTEALDERTDWFPQPHYSYVNMGDTYVTTIIYNHKTERFLCGCWGDIAERFPTNE